jgi:hypothetical protein
MELLLVAAHSASLAARSKPVNTTATPARTTTLDIEGDRFLINRRPTYQGRSFEGTSIEGLLLNARLVQAIFDDLNPATRHHFAYPDGSFDAARNTREFVAAMPAWRAAGLLGMTVNLQGGSPFGYGARVPWHNSAFRADGSLRHDYLERLALVLDAADRLGMVVILGLFYFHQDQRLADEAAVIRAVDDTVDWLLGAGYRNVVIEIANEIGGGMFHHPIIEVGRGHELIARVQQRSTGRVPNQAGRLLASTSMMFGHPPGRIMALADVVLLHGNAAKRPAQLGGAIDTCRAEPAYRGQPIVVNEDDHFEFDRPDSAMLTALRRRASWGLFDYRQECEGYDDGFQSVPVNWQISSPRKRGFFELVARITGGTAGH